MPHSSPDFNPRAPPESTASGGWKPPVLCMIPREGRHPAAPPTNSLAPNRKPSIVPPVLPPEGGSKRGVAQPGRALGSGPRSRWFKSSRPDHLRFGSISAQIFHGPKYSARRRGGRFPLLLTRCGDHLPTADRSGAAQFSGAARRTRAARFLRLEPNRLRIGAAAGMGGVSCGVGRSARAARPPRRAAGSAFWPAGSKGGSIPARFACRRR